MELNLAAIEVERSKQKKTKQGRQKLKLAEEIQFWISDGGFLTIQTSKNHNCPFSAFA